MAPSLLPVLILGLVALASVGGWFYSRWRANKVLADLEGFDTFAGGERLFFGEIRAEFERGPYRCTVTSGSSGSKSNRRVFWRVKVHDVRLGGTTSLRIGHEGMMTRIASKVGMTDIQIGDAEFDRTHRIHGTDENKVRGVLNVPEVQMGVSEAFATLQLYGDIDLWRDETLNLTVKRWGLHAHAAESAASSAFDLAELLDKHRNVKPMQPQLVPEKKLVVPELSSVSGGSGAPVGFGSKRGRS